MATMNQDVNQDGMVLAYLIEIYKQGMADDYSRFLDRFELAKLCVERDLLNAELKQLKGDKPLAAVKDADASP
jgi:hypothetical protein